MLNPGSYQLIIIYLVFLVGPFQLSAQTASLDSLRHLIQTDPPDTNKVEHLNVLGWELMYTRVDTSILLGQQALNLSIDILNSREAASDQEWKRAATTCIGQTCNQLGVYYMIKGDYVSSLRYHLNALKIREKLGVRKKIAASYNNLGLVYRVKGDLTSSIKYYLEALKISIDEGDKNVLGPNLANIGSLYRLLGDYDRALEFYSIAIHVCKQTNDLFGIANDYNAIGNIYYFRKDYSRALNNYYQGLEVSKQLNNDYTNANLMCGIGIIYSALGKYDTAMTYFEPALQMANTIGDDELTSSIMGNMGAAYLTLGDYVNAENYLKQALTLSERSGFLEMINNQSKWLSDVYAKTGRFDMAYKYHVNYTAAKDSMIGEEKSKAIGEIAGKYEIQLEEMARKKMEETQQRLEQQRKKRMYILQYTAIAILFFLTGLMILIFVIKKVTPLMASAISFFALLLLFEFLLVLFDPTIDRITHGEPGYKLLLNGLIAAAIFPLHTFFERSLKKRLVK